MGAGKRAAGAAGRRSASAAVGGPPPTVPADQPQEQSVASAVKGLVCSVLGGGPCSGGMAPVVSSSTYWIPPGARDAPPELPDQTRNYLDPWDLENYAYLRRQAAPLTPAAAHIQDTPPAVAPYRNNNRRRSVAFDEAVHYASYSEDAYGPLSLDEGQLHDVVYEEPEGHYHCPYHRPHHYQYREYQEIDNLECQGVCCDDEALYDGLMQALAKRRKPSLSKHFRLSTLGHLRIDYSSNWNKLDRFIGHR